MTQEWIKTCEWFIREKGYHLVCLLQAKLVIKVWVKKLLNI